MSCSRLAIAGGSAALSLFASCQELDAQPSQSCQIRDFPAPTLCARAGLDTIRATYILLLDESGSMAPIWSQVKSSVAEFIRAVPDGDELDIRLFSGSVRRVNTPVPASTAIRSAWSNQLLALPAPSGARTDLGAALDQALLSIESSPTNRQHFIYLLTDGAQDPSVGSPYPADGGGNWPQLRARAKALSNVRPLSFAIVRLTSRADEQGLLATALPQADVVPAMTSAQLNTWFTREARAIALRKLQLRIAEERRLPALQDSAVSPVRLDASVAVHRRQLRRTIDAVVVDSAVLKLEDGGQVVLHPTSAAEASARLSLVAPKRPWYSMPANGGSDIRRSVEVRVRLEPSVELQRIGISSGPMTDSLRLVVRVAGASLARRISYWAILVLIPLGLWFLQRQVRWRLHKVQLHGKVQTERPGIPSETVDLATLNVHRFEIVTPAGELIATLEARNERGRTAVWLVPDTQIVTVGGRPLRAAMRVLTATRLEHADMTVHYFPRSGPMS